MREIKMIRLAILFLILTALTFTHTQNASSEDIPVYSYKVIEVYPHDTKAFTQGLLWHDGKLYESTGRYGVSEVREVELETGEVLKSRKLEDKYFGEGLAAVGGNLIQLTWRSQTGFVYSVQNLEPIRSFKYEGEGWGLTYNGKHLIKSDGSSTLTFLDPRSFNRIAELEVYDDKGPVIKLNELEYIDGKIYANVWGTDRIAIIEPATGRVEAWIDLTGLLSREYKTSYADVLNGIAYDSESKKLFITGKLWPKIFEIEILKEEEEDE